MKHRSPIWKMPKDQLEHLIAQSSTFTEILAAFGLQNHGGNNQTLLQRVSFEGLDISGLKTRRNQKRGLTSRGRTQPLEQYLVENGRHDIRIKDRLIKTGLLVNRCALCPVGPEWENKPLVLVLDHINGVGNDNRIENLRLLCPNCNSQTATFAGRNLPKRDRPLCICGGSKSLAASYCRKCSGVSRRGQFSGTRRTSKLAVPTTDETLAKLVWEKPVSHVAKDLGVSDAAIKKRCRVRGIATPERGYWQKKAVGKL